MASHAKFNGLFKQKMGPDYRPHFCVSQVIAAMAMLFT
jgi:hypothetical protein